MKSYRVLDAARIAPNRAAAHPFDLRYGVDTAGYLPPQELVTGHAHDACGYGYSAIAPSVFREAARRWRATLPAHTSAAAYCFVDIGAGKGRPLLLASELPFRKVIGVELSADLARVAQQNIARWRRVARPLAPIRVLRQDALAFRWPRPPLLVYLYNPFQCDLVERLLAKLEAWARRAGRPGFAPADVLYVNPLCAGVFSRRKSFSLLWTGRIDMDEADRAADPYGTSFDRVSCYRLRR